MDVDRSNKTTYSCRCWNQYKIEVRSNICICNLAYTIQSLPLSNYPLNKFILPVKGKSESQTFRILRDTFSCLFSCWYFSWRNLHLKFEKHRGIQYRSNIFLTMLACVFDYIGSHSCCYFLRENIFKCSLLHTWTCENTHLIETTLTIPVWIIKCSLLELKLGSVSSLSFWPVKNLHQPNFWKHN